MRCHVNVDCGLCKLLGRIESLFQLIELFRVLSGRVSMIDHLFTPASNLVIIEM